MERKHLRLINNERKAKNILSAKGCFPGYDYCSMLDNSSNCGKDFCAYDYSGCGSGQLDECYKDL